MINLDKYIMWKRFNIDATVFIAIFSAVIVTMVCVLGMFTNLVAILFISFLIFKVRWTEEDSNYWRSVIGKREIKK